MNNFDESNLDALDEMLEFHDISLDPGVDSYDEFKSRSMMNSENRCLHYYVFNANLIKEMFSYTNFRLVDIGETDHDYFALAKKSSSSL
jgi:hypothetical protein